jgi:hypothetical protein
LLLRIAATVAGSGPDLAAFHGAFVALAVLMLMLAGAGLRLRPEAGAAVSGHRIAAARA